MTQVKASAPVDEDPSPDGAARRRRGRRERAQQPQQPKGRVAGAPLNERRYHQTIRRIDLWSVLKLSTCFYLCGLVVVLVALMVLWWIASGLGLISNLESFISDSTGLEDFEFLSWQVLRGVTLFGLVLVCVLVVVTTIAAAFYNLFAEVLGGVEVTVVEEELLR